PPRGSSPVGWHGRRRPLGGGTGPETPRRVMRRAILACAIAGLWLNACGGRFPSSAGGALPQAAAGAPVAGNGGNALELPEPPEIDAVNGVSTLSLVASID